MVCRVSSSFSIIEGKKEKVRDDIAYIEFYGHQVPVVQKLLRTDTWKYIFNGQDRDEYYDLERDPSELCNEISNPDYADDIKKAREIMHDKLKELGDPILRYYTGTRMHE